MKQVYSFFSMQLAAGEYRETAVYGNFLNMLSNSGADNVKISIDGQPEQEIPAGLSTELPGGENFTLIGFRNPNAGAIIITFTVSNGRVFDSRLVLSGTVNTNATPDTLSTPAKGTATAAAPGAPAVAASATTREIHIQNHGPNPLWWGDANVDGANLRGQLIPAVLGNKEIIQTSAAIYLRTTGGNSDYSVAILSK